MSAVIQKEDNSSQKLTVKILDADSNVVKEDSTTAGYGIVSVSADVSSERVVVEYYIAGALSVIICIGTACFLYLRSKETKLLSRIHQLAEEYDHHGSSQPKDYTLMTKEQLLEECKERGLGVSWWTTDKNKLINLLDRFEKTTARYSNSNDIRAPTQPLQPEPSSQAVQQPTQPRTPFPQPFRSKEPLPVKREADEAVECSSCGAIVPDVYRFCLVCGKRIREDEQKPKETSRKEFDASLTMKKGLAVVVKCPSCATIVPSIYMFCLACGKAIRKAEEKTTERTGKETKGSRIAGKDEDETVKCSSCGTTVPDISTFCLACGKKIQEVRKEMKEKSENISK